MCRLVDKEGRARAPKAPSETVRLYVRPSWQRGGSSPQSPPSGYATALSPPAPAELGIVNSVAMVTATKFA